MRYSGCCPPHQKLEMLTLVTARCSHCRFRKHRPAAAHSLAGIHYSGAQLHKRVSMGMGRSPNERGTVVELPQILCSFRMGHLRIP